MRLLKISARGLIFYARGYAWAAAAAALCTAVLCGAMLVGDCVRYSLLKQAFSRLGQVEYAVIGQKGTFRSALTDAISETAGARTAPVLVLQGIAENGDGSARAIDVQVLGIDERFWRLGPKGFGGIDLGQGRVAVNTALSQRLGLGVGDDIVVRVQRAGRLSSELAIVPESSGRAGFRWKVSDVVDDEHFGRFAIAGGAGSSLNVFVPIERLSRDVYPNDGTNCRANMILVSGRSDKGAIEKAVEGKIELDDVGLEVREYKTKVSGRSVFEIRGKEVFLDDAAGELLLAADKNARGIFTYFVNEIRVGQNSTPYSMVAGVGGKPGDELFGELGEKDILLNEWLVDDLQAQVGDEVKLGYFIPTTGGALRQDSRVFRVAGVLPMMGVGADSTLMPDFPELSDSKNCRDWKPGIPIDLGRIRQKDEQYWQRWRGAPKAFVSLAAGQSMWGSRFGNMTAVRYECDGSGFKAILERVKSSFKSGLAGLAVVDVRAAGIKGASGTTDFGGLFAGMSFFLIVSALLLLGLVFAFELENRAGQVGVLKAVGFSGRRIAAVFGAEALVIAILAAAAGAAAGIGYTKLILSGLAGVWQGAVAGTAIEFSFKWRTLFLGFAAGTFAGLLTMGVRIRQLLKHQARELLSFKGPKINGCAGRAGKYGLIAGVVLIASAAAVAIVFGAGGSRKAAGAFFGSGAMFLGGLLILARYVLFRIDCSGAGKAAAGTFRGLALRSVVRRPGRSLAVVALLAMGVFFVIATAWQGIAQGDPFDRKSGTGGFALWAQSGIGITGDLNEQGYRQKLGMEEAGDFEVVGFRMLRSEQASCLNLNRVSRPTLWGVEPGQLAGRDAFSFRKVIDGTEKKSPWLLLEGQRGLDVAPAIGDWASVYWGLGLDIGDRLGYEDETGGRFFLEIVGLLDNSVFQGGLIISDKNFVSRFPSQPGRSVFLVDCAKDRAEAVGRSLSKAGRDYGLEVIPASQRQAEFLRVERTYLAIFTALGFIGLLFGSAGLGLVVVLNVLDRQGELAMLGAMGYQRRRLKAMLFAEHAILLAAGLFCGLAGAAVAVIPSAARSGGGRYGLSALLVLIIAVNGILWVQLACRVGLGRNFLESLRNE